MGWENVIAGDGIGLALTGIFIVFSGLVFISLLIASIPRAFSWAGMAKSKMTQTRAQGTNEGMMDHEPMVWADEEMLAAISCVLQAEMERERALDDQRITMRRGDRPSNWAILGTMRTLSTRM